MNRKEHDHKMKRKISSNPDKSHRKKQKHDDILSEMRKLWERQRVKTISADERNKLSDQISTLMLGNIYEIIVKHDGSRIVQSCFQYGSDENKNAIVNELKGQFFKLSSSEYGRHVIQKILRYGSKEHQKVALKEFTGNIVKLLQNKDSASVLEYAYSNFAPGKQRRAWMSEIYGPIFQLDQKADDMLTLSQLVKEKPDLAAKALKYLFDVLNKVIEKRMMSYSITQKIALDFLRHASKHDSDDIMSSLGEHTMDLLKLDNADGVAVLSYCIVHGTAKERKGILKVLKDEIVKIWSGQNSPILLCTIFNVVDDTVLVKKLTLKPIMDRIFDLCLNMYSRLPFLFLLAPNSHRYLNEAQRALLVCERVAGTSSTSKKDSQIRLSELLDPLKSVLEEVCLPNVHKLVTSISGCDVLFEVMRSSKGDVCTKLMSAVCELCAVEGDENLLADFQGKKTVRRLISLSNDTESEVSAFPTLLFNEVKEHLGTLATHEQSSFTILNLLECPKTSKLVYHSLLPHKSEITLCKSKGSSLIMSRMNELKSSS